MVYMDRSPFNSTVLLSLLETTDSQLILRCGALYLRLVVLLKGPLSLYLEIVLFIKKKEKIGKVVLKTTSSTYINQQVTTVSMHNGFESVLISLLTVYAVQNRTS